MKLNLKCLLNLAMPDAAGRQWFINTARYFTSQVSNINISKHAKSLGISVQDLISCIEDTTSNTARQIIRHLYPPEKLLTMTGSDVPADQRNAIRGSKILSLKVLDDCFNFIFE